MSQHHSPWMTKSQNFKICVIYAFVHTVHILYSIQSREMKLNVKRNEIRKLNKWTSLMLPGGITDSATVRHWRCECTVTSLLVNCNVHLGCYYFILLLLFISTWSLSAVSVSAFPSSLCSAPQGEHNAGRLISPL